MTESASGLLATLGYFLYPTVVVTLAPFEEVGQKLQATIRASGLNLWLGTTPTAASSYG